MGIDLNGLFVNWLALVGPLNADLFILKLEPQEGYPSLRGGHK